MCRAGRAVDGRMLSNGRPPKQAVIAMRPPQRPEYDFYLAR